MKIVIDIPEEVYKQMISKDIYKSIHEQLCYKAIQDGTPIHNVTNGDIVMAFFPNEHDFETDFDAAWWNTPYQKGGKE